MQNASSKQLLMLLTRLGHGSKMVITGDPKQSDVHGRSCFVSALDTLSPIDTISFTHFKTADVVRHPTVKKVIRAWGAMDQKEMEPFTPLTMYASKK
jgi:phosphate starvation-inducible PhoH-like protein